MNLDRIFTKLDTDICCNSLYVCQISASLEYILICVLWRILQGVQKMEKIPETLAACISEMAGAISFKFGIPGRLCLQQIWFQ